MLRCLVVLGLVVVFCFRVLLLLNYVCLFAVVCGLLFVGYLVVFWFSCTVGVCCLILTGWCLLFDLFVVLLVGFYGCFDSVHFGFGFIV